MAKAGPRKIAKYGEKFKATAVKLSSLPGVLIQDVAAALDIHPFMLSLWRKQVREGVIVARASKLDESGQVLNAHYAQKRATDYLRAYCDPTFRVDPPYEAWEVELHSPPPRQDRR